MNRPLCLLCTGCLLLSICSARAQTNLSLEVAFPHLQFELPVDLQHPGDGTNRLFVLEQWGFIRVFENDRDAAEAPVFLNLTDRVYAGGELGLLGLAFHPDFAENGYFFVDYTANDPLRTVVARYQVDPNDPNRADPNSAVVILEVEQPYQNHNGGQIRFGPDGYLYIALGDGGSGGDPHGHGQNPRTLLGSILRIDVDQPSEGRAYGIPPDNPFAGNTEGYREEIFAYGLRNPWRFSFDAATGQLWVADVGQNAYEEINVVTSGGNYGWNVMEGLHCFAPSSGCAQEGLVMPVWEYGRSEGQSITGGFVYRGPGVPELQGKYVYGDYVSGRIWALTFEGTTVVSNEQVASLRAIASFGVDADGELYLAERNDGRIYRFVPTANTSGQREELPEVGHRLGVAFPNPFHTATTFSYVLATTARVEVGVFDVLGRRIRTLVHQVQPAGSHAASWDGRDASGRPVAPGVYLLSLEADGVPVRARRVVRAH